MRELHVRVADDHVDEVTSILNEHDADFTTVPQNDDTLVLCPLPTAAVSPVLDEIRESNVADDSYTVVTKAELVETPNFADLRQRYSSSLRKLAKSEMHAKIRELQWPFQLYYLGTILSVIAAAAGLLLDQPALIIGAMVIAPQASSALAAPAGTLLSDWELFVESIKEQILGLGVAIVGAALFGWFVRSTGFVPPGLAITEIELVGVRLAPTFLSTIGAVTAGIVGAFGYTTEQSTALIGVMIAAALIPAAAATGLAIAWVAPIFGLGALLLLLVNVLAINLGAFITLVAMGYQPDWRRSGTSFRESISSGRRTAVYGTILLLLVATIGTGYLTAANIVFARSVNQEVELTLDQPAYSNLSISGVQAAYGGPKWQAGATNVTVSVSRTSNREYENLASRLERRIERRTNQDVRVTVEFTESRTVKSNEKTTARAAI
ncbi:TIGR00341 family protein [Haladaptatus caseinilyticus]|uniref:TIGR00341 family protein n=1 Tax=Haladaptatus caseinilyticus TaxID=2993314 RepID=UPI00224AEDD9|nr:TIGR00341 family protein [Haladaptatus caseinilyticus]